MKAMETVQDLIEEAKVRTVWWALCIFAFAYFLSHTSKSMWLNIPMAILFVSSLRILLNEVEFRWKVRSEVRPLTYLSHLEKKQLSLNDQRLLTALPPPTKWKRKIDSPIVEAAIDEFINKILQDFVVDLWYSEITPDRDAPELMRSVIMDAIGEISRRVKQLNLVDLLTRDIVDLIGDHLDLFRRNQADIGTDVMGTLSSEERDERLKHHLMASKELHPALISPECEYKVLQKLIGGVLATVLTPREAQCPLVRCIARELVTCLVMQPIMNFASPAYVNELIEYIILAVKDDSTETVGVGQSNAADRRGNVSVVVAGVQDGESTSRKRASGVLDEVENQREKFLASSALHEECVQPRPVDWVRRLEAATQRRTEVLAPEHLDNLWAKGRNYKKKANKNAKLGSQEPVTKSSEHVPARDLTKENLSNRPGSSSGKEVPGSNPNAQTHNEYNDGRECSWNLNKQPLIEGGDLACELRDSSVQAASAYKSKLHRSNSTSALKAESDMRKAFIDEGEGPVISEDFYSPNSGRHNEDYKVKSASGIVYSSEGVHVPKLRCRVIGAYFEKIGSNSFAVYSIAVTDAENATWFVKRRYRNFERLHRHLKDIPNYTLHLPPKRIFSSSTEDAFVHQRCIQLDKYLQDLLSIANVAEQHEVWDFLSASSKNYSFGNSSSVMRSLAVNVDDAVDDIVRQFKGVSGGLMRKVVGPSSSLNEVSPSISGRNLSWHSDEMNKHISRNNTAESTNSFSDIEEGDKDGGNGHEAVESIVQTNGWHSDNELNSKGFPPRVIKCAGEFRSFNFEKEYGLDVKADLTGRGGYPAGSLPANSDGLEDPIGMPPEWTPSNVSVPILNLVDKIFQLKRRGWLRRQVFWISKQILQLVMEDAIDDWLLRQIRWLRRDDVIAQGIRWVQDVLWPDGTFFLRLTNAQNRIDDTEPNQKPLRSTNLAGSKVSNAGSFEQQLEAARRASDVKKMLFEGAPTTLVGLIGHKQYRRCAKDIYYFSQSTICVKQLGYGILELLLISVFPELRDLVIDVHKQMRGKAV